MTQDPNYNMACRSFVLQFALMVEFLSGSFLKQLLGIDFDKETRSFSDKSYALSFNHKVNLLIDLQVVDQTSRRKFQAFMEIRNEFMHVLQCTSYQQCLEMTENYIFLSKLYPEITDEDLEIRSENLITALCNDVLNLTTEVTSKIKQKNREKDGAYNVFVKSVALADAVKNVPNIIDSLITKGFHKTLSISEDQFGASADMIQKEIYRTYADTLKKHDNFYDDDKFVAE